MAAHFGFMALSFVPAQKRKNFPICGTLHHVEKNERQPFPQSGKKNTGGARLSLN
jgi:hypothetical protein